MFKILLISLCFSSFASANIMEEVFVESPTDTDGDGKPDKIYVKIERPQSSKKLASIYKVSPYSLGANDVEFHDTDMERLPQDKMISVSPKKMSKNIQKLSIDTNIYAGYAKVGAHSLGTGYSTGCPTVGDKNETLAAKAVIDWLGGRAKAFNKAGEEVKASWSNGKVGMIGVSYNGTLPTMVASTGVEGLKAIVPIAAISNWYNYYRANGLVVNPGGYIGEDADSLGKYIVRKNACLTELANITKTMGREHGDYTTFWEKRNYLPAAKNIKAAVFIAHGQEDWNVKPKHAIELWEALPAGTSKKLFLHNGSHMYPSNRTFRKNVKRWFDHHIKNDENGIDKDPLIRVQKNKSIRVVEQNQWPHENTSKTSMNLGNNGTLKITDIGNKVKFKEFLRSPLTQSDERTVFLSKQMMNDTLISGTAQINLTFAIMNRKAANISVALVDYNQRNHGTIITRGWADPQNYRDISQGESLIPGQKYKMSFALEPKQYHLKKNHRLGVVIALTDYNFTLRPASGTVMNIITGEESSVEVFASEKIYLDESL